MADSTSVDMRAALGNVLASEHADLLRECVALILREVREMGVARLAGAERCERSEEQASHRNGYCARRLDTCGHPGARDPEAAYGVSSRGLSRAG
jgi:hypothetical protein